MSKSTIVAPGQVWKDRDRRKRELSPSLANERYVRVLEVRGDYVELRRCTPTGDVMGHYPRTSTSADRLREKFTYIGLAEELQRP